MHLPDTPTSSRRRRRASIAVAFAGAVALAVVPTAGSFAADSTPAGPPAYTAVSSATVSGTLTSDIAGSAFVGKDGQFHWTTADTPYSPNSGWAKTFANDDFGAVAAGLADGSTKTATADAHYEDPGSICYQVDKSAVHPIPSPQEDDHCDVIGVWVDPSNGEWYAVLNDEFQFDPWLTKGADATVDEKISTGLHNDRILLATSKDAGASWQYQGPVLTSAWDDNDASGNGIVDATSSPGTTYPFGDSGCRLFVDYSTGYFYITYNVKVYQKPAASTVASWTEMARAPMSGKMAPGTWQKYDDGAWDQPGVGGIDGSVGGPAGMSMSYDPAKDVVSYSGKDAAGKSVDVHAYTVASDHLLTFSDADGNTYTANTFAHTIVNAAGAAVSSVDYTDPVTGESVDVVAKNDVYTNGVKTFTGGIYVTWTNPSSGQQTVQQIITGTSYWKDADSGLLFHLPMGNNESAVSYDAYSETYRIVGYDGNVYETQDLGDPSSWQVVGTMPAGSFGGYLTTLDDGSLTNQNVTGASFLTVSDLSGLVSRIAMPAASGQQDLSVQRVPEDVAGAAVNGSTPYTVAIGGTTLGAKGGSDTSTQWKLVPVSDQATSGASGFYRLENATDGSYLQVSGSTPAAQRAMGAEASDGVKLPDPDPSGNGGVGTPGGSDEWYVQVVAPNSAANASAAGAKRAVAKAAAASTSPTSLAGSTTYRLVNRNSGLALDYENGAFRLAQQSPGDAAQYVTFDTKPAQGSGDQGSGDQGSGDQGGQGSGSQGSGSHGGHAADPADPTADDSALAHTGSDVLWPALGALVVLGAGGGILAARRTRRTQ